ncbi:hypothetical protein HMPREF9141_1666 [Prevotella multiformis DSM 16608]|uniref:Uncharacterized protein n=1 Tax=Prevotella multiformis DSM 16608 TaxID=888743 RepID=F0F7U9_9BACT|nr:hypothetical protein HMPREF9141_1666 [Prevotella multiformis DSM 16608]
MYNFDVGMKSIRCKIYCHIRKDGIHRSFMTFFIHIQRVKA